MTKQYIDLKYLTPSQEIVQKAGESVLFRGSIDEHYLKLLAELEENGDFPEELEECKAIRHTYMTAEYSEANLLAYQVAYVNMLLVLHSRVDIQCL